MALAKRHAVYTVCIFECKLVVLLYPNVHSQKSFNEDCNVYLYSVTNDDKTHFYDVPRFYS